MSVWKIVLTNGWSYLVKSSHVDAQVFTNSVFRIIAEYQLVEEREDKGYKFNSVVIDGRQVVSVECVVGQVI